MAVVAAVSASAAERIGGHRRRLLIVPALVLLAGVPMASAVGTSLAVIALNAFTGFAKYLGVLERESLQLDWTCCSRGRRGNRRQLRRSPPRRRLPRPRCARRSACS